LDITATDAVEVILVNVDDFHAIFDPELVRDGPTDVCNFLKKDGSPVMSVMYLHRTYQGHNSHRINIVRNQFYRNTLDIAIRHFQAGNASGDGADSVQLSNDLIVRWRIKGDVVLLRDRRKNRHSFVSQPLEMAVLCRLLKVRTYRTGNARNSQRRTGNPDATACRGYRQCKHSKQAYCKNLLHLANPLTLRV